MSTTDKPIQCRTGIGSYAFRYAIGFDGFMPPRPMSMESFLEEAGKLGMSGIQLCENLRFSGLEPRVLEAFGKRAENYGMFVEIGMREVTQENLLRHIDLARAAGAGFIRLVLGSASDRPEPNPSRLKERAIRTIGGVLHQLERYDIRLGIENHFDLSTAEIADIVRTLASDRVGVVFDTTNGLGFLESPEQTLEQLLPFIMSLHIKDYYIQKIEAGYLVRGCALGEGELNFRSIVRRVIERHPSASVILEMTIRREPEMEISQVVEWEEAQIIKSVNALKEATDAQKVI